jgi:hypothetical protein
MTSELDTKMMEVVELILKLAEEKFPNDPDARMSVTLVAYIMMGHLVGMPLEDLKEAMSTTMDLLQGVITLPASKTDVLN